MSTRDWKLLKDRPKVQEQSPPADEPADDKVSRSDDEEVSRHEEMEFARERREDEIVRRRID